MQTETNREMIHTNEREKEREFGVREREREEGGWGECDLQSLAATPRLKQMQK